MLPVPFSTGMYEDLQNGFYSTLRPKVPSHFPPTLLLNPISGVLHFHLPNFEAPKASS